MRVKAKKLGYYNLKRRKPGVEFHIMDQKHFSEKWMYSLDNPELNEEGSQDPSAHLKVNEKMSVSELHEYCKEHRLAGYSSFNKKDLVHAINNDLLEEEKDGSVI